MAVNVKRKLVLSVLLTLCVAVSVVAQVEVDMENHTQHGSTVTLPKLSGLSNTFVQDRINQAIYQEGGYQVMLANLAASTADGGGAVQANAFVQVLEGREGQDVLAVRLDASGRVGPGRPTHKVKALLFRLSTGEPVTAEDVFASTDEAERVIRALIEEQISPHVSTYLDSDMYFPLPFDNLLLDDTGITLYYDAQQFSTLSGKAGSLHFHYHEVLPLLQLEEGSVLFNLQVVDNLAPSATTAQAIAADAAAGKLPGIPITLGDNVQQTLARYPKASDSMSFPGGAKYQLEDDVFRGSAIVVDAGVVSGIISQRVNLYGLIIGQAGVQDVVAVLGPSLASMQLDAPTAERYGLPEGTLEDYHFEQHILRLLFDDAGTLQALWLSRQTGERTGNNH